MRATINDIARKAGVSKTTVSFAFNNPSKISKETFDRVMRIADELGYVPDPVARTLATRQTGAIGLLLPQSIQEIFVNPHISEILRGIGEVCDREGLSLGILTPLKGVLSQTIRNAAVDGLITLGIGPGMSVLELFRQRGLPFVTIDGAPAEKIVNVGIDDELSAERLMDEVLARGHRDIAIFTLKNVTLSDNGDHFSLTNDRRFAGFTRACERHGLAPERLRVYHTEVTLESGRAAARAILAEPKRPTAVICLADIQAFGVYEECRLAGVSIPEGLSVVGFDDVPLAQLVNPPLTTLGQSGFLKGELAAQSLVELIAGKTVESKALDAELIVRGSLRSV